MSAERLGPEPTLHDDVRLVRSQLGAWTEVGEHSYLENTTFGDYSYSGPYGYFQNTVVGKFANIAAQVRIGPTMHPMDRPTLHHFTYRRKMFGMDEVDDEAFFAWRAAQIATVGHDTWIGHGVVVMPGVVVGHGAVVGSGAVVTKDVEPYTVVVGVPAREVKRRFPVDIAERLMALGWWDWPHEVLKERLADFCGPVEAFLERWEGR